MSIFDTAIGWVAPPLCVVCTAEGMALCADCQKTEISPYGPACWSCGVLSPGGRTCEKCRQTGSPSYVWLSTVYEDEGAAAQLLRLFKFGHQRAAADTLAGIMTRTLLGYFDERALKPLNYLVVAVPTATSRRRQRGFGHAELLAKKLSDNLGLDSALALGRRGQERQVGAKRPERLSQAHDKYFVRLPHLVQNRGILLIDDVVTTGGTLRAATSALRRSGAKRVDSLLFAKRL